MQKTNILNFVVLLASIATFQAHAGNIDKLALISTIGDTVSVVIYQPGVGSHIDQNRREVLTLPDAIFDETAIRAATNAAQRLSTATPITVVVPLLNEASRKSTTSDGKFVPSTEMETTLRESGASHLLILTKHRANSMLKMAHGTTGTGHLEGLGFYVDRSKRMKRSDTGERGIGFLAPFAYFQATLVDLSTREILKNELVHASNTLSAARLKEGADPWNVLTAEEKVALLQKLVRNEVSRVVPLLLVAK